MEVLHSILNRLDEEFSAKERLSQEYAYSTREEGVLRSGNFVGPSMTRTHCQFIPV